MHIAKITYGVDLRKGFDNVYGSIHVGIILPVQSNGRPILVFHIGRSCDRKVISNPVLSLTSCRTWKRTSPLPAPLWFLQVQVQKGRRAPRGQDMKYPLSSVRGRKTKRGLMRKAEILEKVLVPVRHTSCFRW